MEALIFIALVIIIILLFNIKSRQKEIAERTHQSFLSLKKELVAIKELTVNIPVKEEEKKPVESTDESVVQWRPYTSPVVPEPPVTVSPIQGDAESVPEPIQVPIAAANDEQIAEQEKPAAASPSPVTKESWTERWLRNNPDLEKFIGENLVNKIGITVLVLGIAFFVKYAIDQNWIKEAGRVSIGIGCGIVLIGFAHYLRQAYRSFSSVLAGGGIAVFYFTIAFAFHEYQLFSQTAAFVIMVVITIFAVLLSLLYDKPELAVIAAIGGFITPFLVSTGSGNYVVLFTYLLILNLGMLMLAYFKKWPAINIIALFFTLIIYGGWLVEQTAFSAEFLHYKNSFAFATAFYVLFLGMGMVYNIRTRRQFKAFDFSLLLLITFSYYTAGMTNLHFWNNGAYQGLFTIAMGAINLCLATYFYKTGKGDKNLLYLLIGVTLTFISLAGPIQLHGHTITLFWSAEFVLLYWLHLRSGMPVFKYSSLVIMGAMLISLMMDWENANHAANDHLPVMYTGLQGLVTNLVAVAAFVLYASLARKVEADRDFIAGIRHKSFAGIMLGIAATLFYLTCIFGVNLYFYNSNSRDVPNTWHQLITCLFAVLLLWAMARYQEGEYVGLRLLLCTACIIMYLISIPYAVHLRDNVLGGGYQTVHFLIHWASVLFLLYLVYQAISVYRNNRERFVHTGKLFVWITNIVLVTCFSVEAMHAYIYLTNGVQTIGISSQQYSKAGLTIVWAIYSFAVMWLGMKYKYKTLRIVSLAIFSLALVKLFLFDIRNISEGGKIAAFIMLGVLLLIISFMYQKLKKIIIDDTTG